MLGQKFVVRENTAMRYFFFSLSFGKSQLFQARSSRVARLCSTSTLLPLPNPSALRFIFALPHAQVPLLRQEAIRQLSYGLGAPVQGGRHHTAPHGQGSVLFVILFSASTGTEKPRSTHKQIQSKETERQRLRGQSPKKMASG